MGKDVSMGIWVRHAVIAIVLLLAWPIGATSASAQQRPGPAPVPMSPPPVQEPPSADISLLETGPADAAVTLVEFVDFASEPSSRLAFMLKALVDRYPTQVRVVFKNDPDPSHPETWLAHEAALAAAEQGKFWQMSDVMFSNQQRLQRDDLITMAAQIGLDKNRFQSFLDSGLLRSQIERDRQEADGLSKASAPLCLLNGKQLPWPMTFEALKAAVDKTLAAAQR
jgi:protein-disulfide isomerase